MPIGTPRTDCTVVLQARPVAARPLRAVRRAGAVPHGGGRPVPRHGAPAQGHRRGALPGAVGDAAARGVRGRRHRLPAHHGIRPGRGRHRPAQHGRHGPAGQPGRTTPAGERAPAQAAAVARPAADAREGRAGDLRRRRSLYPPRDDRPGPDGRHRARLPGHGRIGHARAGDPGASAAERGHPAHRPRPGHSGHEPAHRCARRGLWRPRHRARWRHGAALHAQQCRRAGRRPAHHQRGGRPLSAGAAGGPHRARGAQGRLRLRPHLLRAPGAGAGRAPRHGAAAAGCRPARAPPATEPAPARKGGRR